MRTYNIQHTLSTFKYKNKITRIFHKYTNICSYMSICLGLKNEFEIAMIKEPPVFELLKFYCTINCMKFSQEMKAVESLFGSMHDALYRKENTYTFCSSLSIA